MTGAVAVKGFRSAKAPARSIYQPIILINMKKSIFMMMLLASVMCFHSCATFQIEPLQGEYSSGKSVETDKSVDEVWESLIDYFAMSAAPISLIDKESGLIVSERATCSATVERNGKPLDSSAYVIIPDYFRNSWTTSPLAPHFLVSTASFSVRVKPVDGKTLIYVNLYGMRVFSERSNESWGYGSSTGVFEKELLKFLSK